jgi:hypothetical protein
VDPIPLSVHRNTPHTPAVICLALVTVVHQKAPADDFRCASAGNLPRIPPRAAVVQVLDVSGSMLDPACPSCPSKVDVLKDSAELFIQLWGVLAGPGDRIGATYFGSQVDSFTAGGQQLVDVSAANLAALFADLHQRTAVPANRTAMGGGIQRTIEALEAADVIAIPQRHIIVFTDGMQNQNPMVVPGATGLEIRNDGPYPHSNVTPSQPPRVLDAALGVRIHTVGVGATAQFVGLLADIAHGTGAQTWITTAPDTDLRQFFVESVIAALQGNTPQLLDYRRGTVTGTSRERFRLEKGVTRAVFTVSWKRGRRLDVRVERSGIDVTARGRLVAGPLPSLRGRPACRGQLDAEADGAARRRVRGGGHRGRARDPLHGRARTAHRPRRRSARHAGEGAGGRPPSHPSGPRGRHCPQTGRKRRQERAARGAPPLPGRWSLRGHVPRYEDAGAVSSRRQDRGA